MSRNIAELEAALQRARAADRTYVISIDTDPARTTDDGGWWWEVAVPEVSSRDAVRDARAKYEAQLAARAPTAPRSAPRSHRPHRPTNEDARMTAFDVRIGINPLSWMNDDLPSLGGETPLEVALTRRPRRSAIRVSNSATSFRASRRR